METGAKSMKIDGVDATRKRFFVENESFVEEEAGAPILEPGQSRTFQAMAHVDWTPDALAIVSFSAATRERYVKCPVRLKAIELGGDSVEFGGDSYGPRIDLSAKRIRRVQVCESIRCVLENTSEHPVHVKLGYEGHGHDAESMKYVMSVGRSPVRDSTKRRTFTLAPSSPKGSARLSGPAVYELAWSSLWTFRPTRFWLRSKDSFGDLNLIDIKVGNRSQFPSVGELPVEMFEDGVSVACDVAVVGQRVAFCMTNDSDQERHVEIEIEGYAVVTPIVEAASSAN
jgi:hypothetical protein